MSAHAAARRLLEENLPLLCTLLRGA